MGKPVRIKIKYETIKSAGYPNKHRIWDLFPGTIVDKGAGDITVNATKRMATDGTGRTIFTIPGGGSILGHQAEEIPW